MLWQLATVWVKLSYRVTKEDHQFITWLIQMCAFSTFFNLWNQKHLHKGCCKADNQAIHIGKRNPFLGGELVVCVIVLVSYNTENESGK